MWSIQSVIILLFFSSWFYTVCNELWNVCFNKQDWNSIQDREYIVSKKTMSRQCLTRPCLTIPYLTRPCLKDPVCQDHACHQHYVKTMLVNAMFFKTMFFQDHVWQDHVFPDYSHLSNKPEVTLTNFEKFFPPLNKNPPSMFIDFLDFSTLNSSFIGVMY